MIHAHGENIISTMNPKAVGEIMEKQFIKTLQHLEKLITRVDDTSSKVLVTGDLNAGKSTFCNALLRQTILPVDQQPCTEVFCEILDSVDNENKEQVHGVKHGVVYNKDDALTFNILDFSELEAAVLQPEAYASLKVYVNDKRSVETSLLRNGVVDISLIDGPGLNADSMQTTAVYARQEEIDVVVFVVSAENHFTLSAKEFLWNAANEKAFLFIVVNRFDQIRDQDRCRRQILEQVAKLSPRTFAHAEELVHFVSARSVSDEDEDFTNLETQLRNFVLNKRSQSKLLPAKHFASNFWHDAREICLYNLAAADAESVQLKVDLAQIDGKLTQLTRERQQAIDDAVRENEKICEQVQAKTRSQIEAVMETFATLQPEVAYGGLLDCVRFADSLRTMYLQAIQHATIASELQTKHATSAGVQTIQQIGLAHLDPSVYTLRPFHVDRMFSRKRDAMERHLPVTLSPTDFIDLQQFEALVGTSSVSAALVLVGGKALGWSGLVDSGLRVLQVAGIQQSSKVAATAVLLVLGGLGVYAAIRVPHALVKNVAMKVTKEAQRLEYAQINAQRIAAECRKVLSIPEQELRLAFASVVEGEQRTKSDLMARLTEADVSGVFYKEHAAVMMREAKKLELIEL
ncbi:P-loop containing nucleoside triphosphate hydrolase protein [Protomyces lactucae-debilis]|uniref:p-loop containing nucleoside triphosphate hydrolase protein n=1 Tax=Protomyces lactucae-debilis TaxID=2754530 RepID=A0A1Y2FNS8_PROLT|nr:P-loop containing nucleoside triphosphate hydrolase protein [Protomyces lactucae-debilis]ORY85628.1 P-loop containing nucleoside triphosphate hydrolase protein [Protomyces lactucae-debilis]